MISPKPERLTALLLALARGAGLALSGIFSPGVWRTSLAGLDSGPAWRGFVISRAELARWRRSHSAYIPELTTLSGFCPHTAAQPFNRGQVVSAGQTGFSLVRVDAPSSVPPAGFKQSRPRRVFDAGLVTPCAGLVAA